MVASDEGDVRIIFSDQSYMNRRLVWQGATERLDGSTLQSEQIIIPLSAETLHQDDLLIVEVKLTTASSADYGLSTVQIPVTKLNKSTKQETATYLRDSDIRSADVTLATTWTTLGTYTVTAQEALKLGQRISENSRIYISFTENA